MLLTFFFVQSTIAFFSHQRMSLTASHSGGQMAASKPYFPPPFFFCGRLENDNSDGLRLPMAHSEAVAALATHTALRTQAAGRAYSCAAIFRRSLLKGRGSGQQLLHNKSLFNGRIFERHRRTHKRLLAGSALLLLTVTATEMETFCDVTPDPSRTGLFFFFIYIFLYFLYNSVSFLCLRYR